MTEITESGAAMAAAYMRAKQGTVDVAITLTLVVNVPEDKATDKLALAAAAAEWISDQAAEPEGDEELATRIEILTDDEDDDPDREAEILELAGEQWAEEGQVEIDSDAKVSEGNDNGAYVQAWVWVDFAGTDLDKEDEDEDDEAVEGEDDLDAPYTNLEAAGVIGPKVASDA
jgi:hypothetical protein